MRRIDRADLLIFLAMATLLGAFAVAKAPSRDLCKCGVACECADPHQVTP